MSEAAPAILDLDPDFITQPNRLHLAQIEAMMLFPHSPSDREMVYRASIVEFAAENPDQIPEYIWKNLFYISRSVNRIDEIREAVRSRCVKGLIVGIVTHFQIASAKAGIESRREDIINQISSIARDVVKSRGIRVSAKTFHNDMWPEFRSVAHFWAASVILNETRYHDTVFPCRVSEIEEFLSTVEAYRIAGESSRPKQASATILDPKHTVRLPSELKVEPADLQFIPTTNA
jgi:hypothetical protein